MNKEELVKWFKYVTIDDSVDEITGFAFSQQILELKQKIAELEKVIAEKEPIELKLEAGKVYEDRLKRRVLITKTPNESFNSCYGIYLRLNEEYETDYALFNIDGFCNVCVGEGYSHLIKLSENQSREIEI